MNKSNRLTESDINRIVKRTIKEAILREGWMGGMQQAMGNMAGNSMGNNAFGGAKSGFNAAQGGMTQGQQQQGINPQTVQSLQQVYQMLGQVIKSLNSGQ